ncbi:MAG: chromosomal replication initiator protein DnaA [Clostridia bacterium]|uniref:Chromosomal replication initiator protein DnaA n=1 Tax=Peptococcus niger TaxID=2741 RepID=A0A1G6Z2B7_PEPNI|nr:chromosomal replication initiator protein DnaA [Peptococcus niger]MDU7243891.1 chromosomal replication initiator protein DnaA [Clostridiales bacterium]MDU7505179.1 chromosomal replication initiator protein DnaA [Clostridia bacterium]SDD96087.1 chromosomal replication initiator protein DnaA [Peptococcus niger]
MTKEHYQGIWQGVMVSLENEVNLPTYDTFFKNMTLAGYYEGTYILAAGDAMKAEMMPPAHLRTLERLIAQESGENDVKVKIIPFEEDLAKLDLPKVAEAARPALQEEPPMVLMGEYRINTQNTFENFVVGKSNQFAHAASLAIAEGMAMDLNDKKVYNPLFIYGGSGLGKTHLMHAIAHHIIKAQPKANIIYVSSEKFTNELIDSIRDNRPNTFRDKYRQADLLLIDDIQFLAKKEGTQEEFFHTFNELYEKNKQIVISSDRTPKEIPTLEERLRTRFEWGLITDIQPPDLETRIAILRKKAQMDHKEVSNDITAFMAEHMETNIRELEGALLSLTSYATMNNLPLTLDLAKDFLEQYVEIGAEKNITGESIQSQICDTYGVRLDDLIGKKRNRNIVFPRQVAMYLCRDLTDMSLPKIGEIFGGRDHTTVIHAIEKIDGEIKKDPAVKATVHNLKKVLRGE